MWLQLPVQAEIVETGNFVSPLPRPGTRSGVTLPRHNTRGRCPKLRHRQITEAALRPAGVFLLHVGTQDGIRGSGGCA